MVLHKISEFDPNYLDTIQGNDIKGMGVYTQGTNDKIGTVNDALIDEKGQFRYLIVDVGFWIFGKKVLLPLGRTSIDFKADRAYTRLTKEQAEQLPEYEEGAAVDYDYEEQVRGVYREPQLEASAPLEAVSSAAVVQPVAPRNITPVPAPTYDRDTYNYDRDADLYDTTSHPDQTIKLYEERLVANKERRKTGEVAIGKHVETETARVAIGLDKERVVIERVTPENAGKAVTLDATAFREGEVAHMDIYEETPDIHKEAFLREEVRVTKVVDQETVQAQETIRKEELDIDTEGLSVEKR
ncbi:MAG: DUF2382 domain-containing protein [Cyanomargarita calcarea GSE-NOS-MK-12-04C]|jgi:uncharacterized protein (TIGR02271 family)|uniref:DUF2382 domain-containing protein n=1 Tax=Cyanomargarita calcarea GSE-NOS-MK-12-04C TaxID=2839659 RepID=A0A951QHD1_9CYAN|nr:DUF2382 domain-containing protein [Cyanomargarita calcarea GSE-NOS-MK-12-04C]